MKRAARGSLKMQDPKNCHFGTMAQFCRAISSDRRHVSTIGKKLLNSDTSSTCSDNMVNFGLLTAEICWRVWGTPANFASWQRYAWHSSRGRQPNFAALNRGRHLYSAGRPSRWVSAHISSCLPFILLYAFCAVWISLLPRLCHFSAFLFS